MSQVAFSCLVACLACLIVAEVNATLVEPIPVLLWSPDRRMSELAVDHANVIESGDFHKAYVKPLMSDESTAAVMFLQDMLHTDDFTQFADVFNVESEGGAFKNIKHLMEENFSLEMPQVSHPVGSLEKLKREHTGLIHTVTSLEELNNLDLKGGSNFLLVVRLPSVAKSFDREATLRESDAMIGNVCGHLQKRSIKYVAAFTGEQPSKGMSSDAEVHSSRRLMATAVKANGTLMNITGPDEHNAFLFMTDIYICVRHTNKPGCISNFTIIPQNNSADTSVVGNKTATISLVFNNTASGGEDFNIKITTDTLLQGDRWVISRMSLYITPLTPSQNSSNIQNGTLSRGEMDLVVPILYSYHCTEMKMMLDWNNDEFKDFQGTYVTFNGYQFQPFNVQNNRFFQSVDCVGFFTAAIWMGLFPVALLLIILMYGTLMLLSLTIMDRYDDPKGKTISVHASAANE